MQFLYMRGSWQQLPLAIRSSCGLCLEFFIRGEQLSEECVLQLRLVTEVNVLYVMSSSKEDVESVAEDLDASKMLMLEFV